jgi:hypothetical protein
VGQRVSGAARMQKTIDGTSGKLQFKLGESCLVANSPSILILVGCKQIGKKYQQDECHI